MIARYPVDHFWLSSQAFMPLTCSTSGKAGTTSSEPRMSCAMLAGSVMNVTNATAPSMFFVSLTIESGCRREICLPLFHGAATLRRFG